jgi:hypothetical protein|tara:strand:+ start:219 stop:908 length:690 start_codon:yes stop_codon:yes gene_type:complete
MAISDYDTLKSAVAGWLDRSDMNPTDGALKGRVEEFIALAEARMNRTLRLSMMLNVDQTTLGGAAALVAGTRDYALPSGYLQMLDFHLRTDPITTLSYLTLENMNRMWAGSQGGRPQAYTIFSDNASGTPVKKVRLGPSPDVAYDYSITFYKKIDALSASNETEQMLTDNPDVYLYGALMEAEPFLMNDARVQLWAAALSQSISALQEQDNKDRHSGSAMRVMNTGGYQ